MWAARPPLLAISRCFCGSIDAKPRPRPLRSVAMLKSSSVRRPPPAIQPLRAVRCGDAHSILIRCPWSQHHRHRLSCIPKGEIDTHPIGCACTHSRDAPLAFRKNGTTQPSRQQRADETAVAHLETGSSSTARAQRDFPQISCQFLMSSKTSASASVRKMARHPALVGITGRLILSIVAETRT